MNKDEFVEMFLKEQRKQKIRKAKKTQQELFSLKLESMHKETKRKRIR